MNTEPNSIVDPQVRVLLEELQQPHLLEHLESTDPQSRNVLSSRLLEIDWQAFAQLYTPPSLAEVSPTRVVQLAEQDILGPTLTTAGSEAYRKGQIAILVVAGGQGTRLGHPGAKGTFPIAPLSGKSLYQLHAEKIIALSQEYGATVPLLIMTSPATHDETVAFFVEHKYFGLQSEYVRCFQQATVPSTDEHGRLLLAGPDKLAENPDGHGGVLTALQKSGLLAWLQELHITDIIYIQVDNPLARLDDPFMIGLRTTERLDMITKVLPKSDALEKVGALVTCKGHPTIVEYSDLTHEQAYHRTNEGRLLFGWGSPSLYCVSTNFLSRLTKTGYQLPYHQAAKPIHCWSPNQGTGQQLVLPGIKRERFFFDIVTEAAHCGLEIIRQREFAPVKNLTGIDSAQSAQDLLTNEYSRWLRAAGAKLGLPNGSRVEVSPCFAATEAQFIRNWPSWCQANGHEVRYEVQADLLIA